jgi:hypothetical protein
MIMSAAEESPLLFELQNLYDVTLAVIRSFLTRLDKGLQERSTSNSRLPHHVRIVFLDQPVKFNLGIQMKTSLLMQIPQNSMLVPQIPMEIKI